MADEKAISNWLKSIMTFIDRVGFPIFAFLVISALCWYTTNHLGRSIDTNTQMVSSNTQMVSSVRALISDINGQNAYFQGEVKKDHGEFKRDMGDVCRVLGQIERNTMKR